MNVTKSAEKLFNKSISECTDYELYLAVMELIKTMTAEKKHGQKQQEKKKLYYISAEFLIGKLMSNNLINLGIYDQVSKELASAGRSLAQTEEAEPEPSLGNGGLGRLAACFLDSIATLGLCGDGIGLNYHFGLFKQVFKNCLQTETINPWIEKQSWLKKTDTVFTVMLGGQSVTSRLYDIDVIGYENRINKLHLFDIESVDETIVKDGISFDKEAVNKNLTLFLYPDDSDDKGRLLRIYQQYFMVSSGAQFIIKECLKRGSNLKDLYDYAVIQINDTHPTLVIPELVRLLMEHGLTMDTAIEVVSKTCAYTNHTILAEALETWPLSFLEQVVPQLIPIIEILDGRARRKFDDTSVAIIDKNNYVHMAHMDIHYGFSINGVAKLHTEILKNNELNNFYKIYPEKFNNKTNGITFRRWLIHCNHELTSYLESLIGPEFKKDACCLEELLAYKEDKAVLLKLLEIKQRCKLNLRQHLLNTQGIDIDEHSIFDIQVKRLHEYKRQQMNVLYVIHKYLEIKKGVLPLTPVTVIFGAKAAPAYTIAKDIIHAVLCLQEIINHDPSVSPYLRVVMVENYNVAQAEQLIPACDISEQISLASKEASGTGNMKFMLNGAVTLGTMDGANVEISQLVGEENIYIFGTPSSEVIRHYRKKDYNPKKYYQKVPAVKESVDFLVSPPMLAVGQKTSLGRLYQELLNKDYFMTLLDFESYVKEKELALHDYEDKMIWAGKMLVNIAKAGFFSSDRTIGEYNRDIWKL